MCKCRVTVFVCLALALAGCQSTGQQSSGKGENYFTWVDEQGQVRKSVIPKTARDDEAEPGPGQSSSDSGAPDTPENQPDQSGSGQKAVSDRRDDEFNLENYPDGDQLEKDGYVRPGEPQPYFTWQDSEGNIRVSYYQPDTRSAVEKGRIKPPVRLTEASIHQAGAEAIQADLPDDADPEALAVLGMDLGGGSFFEQWAALCCEDMDTAAWERWQQGREFGVDIDDDAPVHDFYTGESPYRLIRLPDGGAHQDFILHLKSFARDGVFVPSVVFLDGAFAPMRIVTDMVADFVPEAWHRHGYLQAYIPVFPSRGERWMIIFTRDEDLTRQTVIEGKYGPEPVPHTRNGELGLSRVEE